MTDSRPPSTNIHADGRIARTGVAPQDAERAMVLVHGRGATPESILALVGELPEDLGFAFVAPGASESTAHPRSWYPNSFLAQISHNEPGISSGLQVLSDLIEKIKTTPLNTGDILNITIYLRMPISR